MKLKKSFFDRDTLIVAKDLVGKIVCRKVSGEIIKGRIIETEAYIGEEDKACHARFGRTKRNEIMYGDAGHAYIYLCYGLFNLFNVVCESAGKPAAVLIRKIEPLSGYDKSLKSYGPGNLTKYLKIDRALNGKSIQGEELWFEEDGFKIEKIESSKRIGVDYAGEWKDKEWRFILKQG